MTRMNAFSGSSSCHAVFVKTFSCSRCQSASKNHPLSASNFCTPEHICASLLARSDLSLAHSPSDRWLSKQVCGQSVRLVLCREVVAAPNTDTSRASFLLGRRIRPTSGRSRSTTRPASKSATFWNALPSVHGCRSSTMATVRLISISKMRARARIGRRTGCPCPRVRSTVQPDDAALCAEVGRPNWQVESPCGD